MNVHQAKTNFSKLLARVELGEEIIISNRGLPVAKLVPYYEPGSRSASIGLDRGRFTVPKTSTILSPADLLEAFEGGPQVAKNEASA